MNDREKLDKLNEIGCNIHAPRIIPPSLSKFIDIVYSDFFPWQPSNRPCYDKPAGTPIRHEETVKDTSNHIIDEMRYLGSRRNKL